MYDPTFQYTGLVSLINCFCFNFCAVEASGIFEENDMDGDTNNLPTTSNNVEVTISVPGKKKKCGKPYVVLFTFKCIYFNYVYCIYMHVLYRTLRDSI